jgi:hypothetical protein
MTRYKVHDVRSLRDEMKAVARGERRAAGPGRRSQAELQLGRCRGLVVDAGQPGASRHHP